MGSGWVVGLVGFGWAGGRAGGCMDGWMYRGGMMDGLTVTLTEIFGLWLIPAALELQYCSSRAATTCSSRAALKYFVCKLVFRL